MLRKILPPVAVAAGAFFLLSNDPASAQTPTEGDDTLTGTDGNDTINALGGNDTVDGGAGDDTIDGGTGNDTINGGTGNDEIGGDDVDCPGDTACGGDDVINAGDGDDEIGGDDNFCAFEGGGATAAAGACAGNDTINGGGGNDEIYGDDNVCIVVTGAAGDCAANDTIDGGEDDDEIFGDGNVCIELDNVAGAVAAASVGYTCGGDDTINGGAGDDEIYGDGNNDVNDGGFCGAEGSFGLDDSCAGDDTINGGAGDDYIEGDGVECFIFNPDTDASFVGCAGDDILDGGDGDDLIFGDTAGFEPIGGGEGFCFFFSPNTQAVAAAIADPTIFELCIPGGADTITGGIGDDAVFAGNGNDLAGGGAGADFVFADLGLYFFENFDGPEDALDFLENLSGDALLDFYFTLYFLDTDLGGGDDEVAGDAGVDVVLGEGGHDVVCGDATDGFVTGGGGSDVPCPVVEGTFDATSGSVTIDLGNGIRELDDEFLEINEDGTANPWELVILIAPTKGTLTLVGETVTYTVNPGATGTDFFEYAIRRKIIDCPGEVTVTFSEGQRTIALCENNVDRAEVDLLRAAAVIDVGGVRFVQSGSKRITLTLQTPPPPPPPPPAPQPPAVAAQTAALPVTGGGDLGLALAGLGLVALGAVVTAESRRRRSLLEVRA